MNKKEELMTLNHEMHKKSTNPLKKNALNPVFGEGNADADIVFIGEAPGKKEDESGKPFIGAAGKILDELLQSIHLNRDDIYITNIVKYRPPKNRDPLPKEIDESRPWLTAQLKIIKPKLIIPLGRHALERFVPGKKISLDHGSLFSEKIDSETYHFYALYHPAASIYNRKLRKALFDDFQKIPSMLKNISKD